MRICKCSGTTLGILALVTRQVCDEIYLYYAVSRDNYTIHPMPDVLRMTRLGTMVLFVSIQGKVGICSYIYFTNRNPVGFPETYFKSCACLWFAFTCAVNIFQT